MIRVVLSGATGKVGRALISAFAADPGIELVAQAAPSLGVGLEEALVLGADVAVDFSTPASAGSACAVAVAAGVPLVLGTSGLPPAELERHGA
jgi:4-hydroxy-tetrahydrodipicolinate reductase